MFDKFNIANEEVNVADVAFAVCALPLSLPLPLLPSGGRSGI